MKKEKLCYDCGEWKPMVRFNKHFGMKDGRINQCKKCSGKADRIRQKKKRDTNPVFRAIQNMRKRFNEALRTPHRPHINSTELFGMHPADIMPYLLNKFPHFKGKEYKVDYVIDHIVPYAVAKNKNDVNVLCHYTNLQLLTRAHNGNKYKSLPRF